MDVDALSQQVLYADHENLAHHSSLPVCALSVSPDSLSARASGPSCRASLGRAGLVSSPDADWYVSLDRCSPAMYVYARAGLGRTKHGLDPPLSISSLAIATPLVGLAGL